MQIGSTGIPIIEKERGNGKAFLWHLWYYDELRDTKMVWQASSAGGRGSNNLEESLCLTLGRCISPLCLFTFSSLFLDLFCPSSHAHVALCRYLTLVGHVLLETSGSFEGLCYLWDSDSVGAWGTSAGLLCGWCASGFMCWLETSEVSLNSSAANMSEWMNE